jgi:hypothetical protein
MLHVITTFDECGLAEYIRMVDTLRTHLPKDMPCQIAALTGPLSTAGLARLADLDVAHRHFDTFEAYRHFEALDRPYHHPQGKLCKHFFAREYVEETAAGDDLVLFLDPDTLVQRDLTPFLEKNIAGKVLFGYEMNLSHTAHRNSGRLMVAKRFDAESAFDRSYITELNTGVVLGLAADFVRLMGDFYDFVLASPYFNTLDDLEDEAKWHDQDFFRYFYRSTLRADVATFEFNDVFTAVNIGARCLYYDVRTRAYKTVWGGKPAIVHFAGGTFHQILRVHPIQNALPDAPEETTPERIKIERDAAAPKVLLVSAGLHHLVRSWLRTHSDTPVVLLPESSTEEARAACQALATAHPQVTGCLPAMDALEENAPLGTDTAILPLTGAAKALEFVPGAHAPALDAQVYGAVRKLWRRGVRRFTFASYHGAFDLALPYLLDGFVDRHKGQRCFVVGNGPSLNQIDMGLLHNEITFGSNRCFMGYENWGMRFSYWGIMDRLQVEEYAEEYEDQVPADTIKFFPFEYASFLQVANACPVNFIYNSKPPYRFSDSPDELYLGFTVTHMLMQVAAIMGCDPIYLIGCDHHYNLQTADTPLATAGNRNAQVWTAGNASAPTHFTAQYTTGAQPKRFITPKPDKSEAAFAVANAWATESGRSIINATPGTGLHVFPKVDFTSLF